MSSKTSWTLALILWVAQFAFLWGVTRLFDQSRLGVFIAVTLLLLAVGFLVRRRFEDFGEVTGVVLRNFAANVLLALCGSVGDVMLLASSRGFAGAIVHVLPNLLTVSVLLGCSTFVGLGLPFAIGRSAMMPPALRSLFAVVFGLAMFVVTFATSNASLIDGVRRWFRSATPQELFVRYRGAVVKITTLQQGVPVSHGAGFFIAQDGTLLTNRHVVSHGLSEPGQTLAFELEGGVKSTAFHVLACSERQDVDACVLRMDGVVPTAWFRVDKQSVETAQPVFTLGHPRGLDFSISDGMVSGLRKIGTVDYLQITAPISPGNSGGPVFGSDGTLFGMATALRNDGQNLNFALSVNELVKLVSSTTSRTPLTAEAFRERLVATEKRVADELTKTFVDPAYQKINRGEDLASLSQFRKVTIRLPNVSIHGYLPNTFTDCQVFGEKNDFACFDDAGGLFELRQIPIPNGNGLALLQALPREPTPLPIVQELMRAGQWESYKKTLTEKQLKYLFSVKQPYKCHARGNFPGSFFESVSDVCTTSTYNDGLPNVASYELVYEVGSYLYNIRISSGRTGAYGYYFQIPTIFALSARGQTSDSQTAR